eukprot:2439396-Pyramimonas_sp.AAC.1
MRGAMRIVHCASCNICGAIFCVVRIVYVAIDVVQSNWCNPCCAFNAVHRRGARWVVQSILYDVR